MKKAMAARRREQAAYQRAYRARQTADRKPGRDDVARVVLHWVMTEMLCRSGPDVARLRGIIIDRLVSQGFSESRAAARVDDLLDRYEDGWTFQRKSRLLIGDT